MALRHVHCSNRFLVHDQQLPNIAFAATEPVSSSFSHPQHRKGAFTGQCKPKEPVHLVHQVCDKQASRLHRLAGLATFQEHGWFMRITDPLT